MGKGCTNSRHSTYFCTIFTTICYPSRAGTTRWVPDSVAICHVPVAAEVCPSPVQFTLVIVPPVSLDLAIEEYICTRFNKITAGIEYKAF